MHLSDGEIRASLDQALSQADQARVQAHLEQCTVCQSKAVQLQERARFTAGQIAALSTAPAAQHSGAAARRRLEARLAATPKEVHRMSRFFSRLPRAAWAGLALVLLLGAALIFPSVRAAASNFLGLFRVQKIQMISVDANQLNDQLGDSSTVQAIFDENVHVEQTTEGQEAVDAAEAAALAGFQVRTPQRMSEDQWVGLGAPSWTVGPSGWIEIKIQLDQINTLLHEMDRADLRLPRQLDGETVRVDVQPSVTATWGDCVTETRHGADPDEPFKVTSGCTTLVQMPSPTVIAPDGLDLVSLGEIYLEVMGVPRAEAERFAATIDWSSTLVLPIPQYEASYEDVTVDGVPGVIVKSHNSREYMLLWVRDGIVHALSGSQSLVEALRIANSLQ